MAPGCIMADDLVDDVLKVQSELFHRQVLTLWAARGGVEWGACANRHPSRLPRAAP